MPTSLPQLSVRMNQQLYDKLRYIAEYNARSASREVELLIRNHVERFERKHGAIEMEQPNASKPT
jgi:hypothetical protein